MFSERRGFLTQNRRKWLVISFAWLSFVYLGYRGISHTHEKTTFDRGQDRGEGCFYFASLRDGPGYVTRAKRSPLLFGGLELSCW